MISSLIVMGGVISAVVIILMLFVVAPLTTMFWEDLVNKLRKK